MYSESVESTPFEFLPQGQDLVDIPAAGLQQAISLSQSIGNPHYRWQTYLTLLALSGFAEWFEVYAADTGMNLSYDDRQVRLIIPSQPGEPAAIAAIQLNDHFRICLIATTGTIDEIIELPQAIVERPRQLAHFYVNVMVNSEAQVAAVRSFLRYDQLQKYRQTHNLKPLNGVYQIPVEQFESRIDRLWLFANSLNPQAIPLAQNSLQETLAPIKQLLIQPVINAGSWIQRQFDGLESQLTQQLDQASQAIGNLLLLPDDFNPALVPAFDNMRSSNTFRSDPTIDALQAIQQQGYAIPVDVRVNYQDLCVDEQRLRLTFVTWQLPPAETGSTEIEWSLLVITQLLNAPSEPIQISIQQPTETLATASIDTIDNYTVLQVFGSLDEQFTVEVANTQTALVLPAFEFVV
jgi:Protein of unknown function (DUF1822)